MPSASTPLVFEIESRVLSIIYAVVRPFRQSQGRQAYHGGLLRKRWKTFKNFGIFSKTSEISSRNDGKRWKKIENDGKKSIFNKFWQTPACLMLVVSWRRKKILLGDFLSSYVRERWVTRGGKFFKKFLFFACNIYNCRVRLTTLKKK